MAVFFVAIWGAYLIRSMLLWVLGMITFWTTRVSAIYDTYFTAELLLSGRLVPLALLPAWATGLADVLPFKYTFGYPIEVLAGSLSTRELFVGLGFQAVWIGIGTVLVAVVWRVGVRRFGAVGARVTLPLRLAGTFLRVGILNELQYRVNFAFSLVQSVISVGTSIAVLALVFGNTDSLHGWSAGELLVVMGVYVLVGGLIKMIVQPNMQQLMEDVQQGTLDFVLTKPADGQLLVSVRRVQLWQGVDILVGGVLIVIATVRLPGTVSALDVLAFVLSLPLGAVAIYCFWLLLTTVAFWVTRLDPIVELFDGMYQAGRWPVSVYPGWLRVGFTILVPLAFAVTVPGVRPGRARLRLAAARLGRLHRALALLTRWVWRPALRRYSGASS